MNLKYHRLKANITRRQLGLAIHRHPRSIANYETEQRELSIAMARQIIAFFKENRVELTLAEIYDCPNKKQLKFLSQNRYKR